MNIFLNFMVLEASRVKFISFLIVLENSSTMATGPRMASSGKYLRRRLARVYMMLISVSMVFSIPGL